MFSGAQHAELAANWLRENDFPSNSSKLSASTKPIHGSARRNILAHALVSTNQLVKQIGIGFNSGNCALDPLPWDEMPSTKIIWEARGNKDYDYEDFTRDILNQFESFPDLL